MIKPRNRPSISMTKRYVIAKGFKMRGRKLVVIPHTHREYPLQDFSPPDEEGHDQEVNIKEFCRIRAKEIRGYERVRKQMRKAEVRKRMGKKREALNAD